MAKLSKTAKASGATGIKKSKGPKRNRPKHKVGHRAHKRDSVVIPPAKEGEGRDARKAARRAARRAELAVSMDLSGGVDRLAGVKAED